MGSYLLAKMPNNSNSYIISKLNPKPDINLFSLAALSPFLSLKTAKADWLKNKSSAAVK